MWDRASIIHPPPPPPPDPSKDGISPPATCNCPPGRIVHYIAGRSHAELGYSASSARPAAFMTTDTPPALERTAEPPAQPLAQHRATHSDVPPPPTPTLQRRGFIPRTLSRQARRRTAQPHRIQPHRQLAEAIASRLKFMRDGQDISSCTRPITFNTATIASRLKILTVGGRANWVNCSPHTRFCIRLMAPNTETTNLGSNSFILDFGDLGLTLHSASIYFKFTRDYILRGPRLVFLTCAAAVSTSRFRSYPCPSMPDGAKYRKYCRMNEVKLWRYARRPSYSLKVQPPVYRKYCCMKPEFEIMVRDSLQPTALSKYSWISGISEMSSKPRLSTRKTWIQPTELPDMHRNSPKITLACEAVGYGSIQISTQDFNFTAASTNGNE
ncbi:hypothetical protein DFH09DRAFT_1105658 [Mycena vulgaris]|nr:hypothetical protein DFH09DRAFT_1105658 [Mycena vulgaris]